MSDQVADTSVEQTVQNVVETATEAAPEALIATEGAAEAVPEVKVEEIKVNEKVEAQKKQEAQFAAKFAALSRKEKQLRDKERSLEARMKQIEQQLIDKEKEFTTKFISPERIKKEPLKIMQEQGLTFEQLAEMALNNGKPTVEMIKAELEQKMEAQMAEWKKKFEDKETQEQEAKYEQTLNTFVASIEKFVSDNNNDYELIRANDAADLVYKVIEEHHEKTRDEDTGVGEILDTKQAADAVEAHLLENAKKNMSLNKIKGLLASTEQKPEASTQKKTSVTLSNAAASTATKTGARKLTMDESKREAAKLLRWDD